MSETTIYDSTGHAVVYATNDGTIYTWDGHAVAYLYDGQYLYGWNGHHLGFWIDGVVYDLQGQRVGFERHRCPVATYAEYAKSARYAQYAKYARYAPFVKPALSTSISPHPFNDFITSGKVG